MVGHNDLFFAFCKAKLTLVRLWLKVSKLNLRNVSEKPLRAKIAGERHFLRSGKLSFLIKEKHLSDIGQEIMGLTHLFLFSRGPELAVLQSETMRGAWSRRLCKTSLLVGEHVLHCDPFGTARRANVSFAIQNA